MAELAVRLQAAVGSTYRIDHELGGGGMSRVFLADEPALGRKVVIKVLPPEMAAGVNRDRFQREIQLAARLQHPHIVQLLAAGSADDLLWYVMPFIEGESLRTRLARSGELPVKDALRILREVADALSYAHEQGVVHRDIKPDNVLLAGKHALVTDFGVAKAVTESSAGSTLTSLGMALGTPAYMAPEQASGDPNVDHRADLYALGAMAYEMLCGQPPFTGSSPQAVLTAHVIQVPVTVSSVRPAVPAALNAIVMRCLEKHAADRWQSAEELASHLEALLTPSGGISPTSATPVVSSATEALLRWSHPLRVAVLFVVGAGLLAVVFWWLVQQLGLPDWVFLAGVILLVLGLPILLFAGRHERQRALARTTGFSTGAPVGAAAPLTTFRGAITGGIVAFATLVLGVGTFMGLRAAGVGPFATLVSAGVLSQRDRLILADFDNRTSDSTLAESVTAALRIDLAQSTMVRLMEASDIAAGLERMKRQPGGRITGEVAREIAEREGAKAVIVGEIAPLGSGFVLTARVIGTNGTTLLAERETASDATQLIAAVDQLSKKLREGIGESLKSIRAGEPLELVTTGSLDALRKYSQAERLADQARYESARLLLEEAIAIDSTFGMAWRKLAVVVGNTFLDPAKQLHASQRAYDLRDRLPERERLLATAWYFANVEIDLDREIPAYEQLLARWPEDIAALNNLSIAYGVKRRWVEAESLAARGLQLSPQTGVLWFNLIDNQVIQGRVTAAESSLKRWGEVAPEARNRFQVGYRLAWAKNDYPMAVAYADTLGRQEPLNLQALARFQKANIELLHGKLDAAEALVGEGVVLNLRRGAVQSVYNTPLPDVDAQLRGRPDLAVSRLDSILRQHPLDSLAPTNRPYLALSRQYAMAGDTAKAGHLFREYERVVPEILRRSDPERFLTQGIIALARGAYQEAIGSIRSFRDRDGCQICWQLQVGQAFDAMNQTDSAIAAYELMATFPQPGVAGKQFGLPQAYYRLGELYETKGERQKAIEYYGKFADLWKDADAELQPRVKAARERIAELTRQAN